MSLTSSSVVPIPGDSREVVHVVLFKYLPSVSSHQKIELASAFLNLKETCLKDNKPYILSIEGGINHSPEKAGQGFDHAYVVRFSEEKYRNYYVEKDPTHIAFKDLVKPHLEQVDGALVFDFTPGGFIASRNTSV